ncbi:LPS export ABC transporter periplasmic protein LptC [Aquimarina sp. U1-2]|uniref:LPS export ABC transporter periplasmic protein LptC n=1 Tax=Aquimarina sp. U1-2 TaxID=2823141 RepID=UPI001AEC887F|nr:LPS export ABC transporter periplasmic protein LptC [Aquimarina sp. U1-2]MBP2831693.1 LPS export ABC transporter periplasmic protein LptC [Aquimarina sp. U1-2]
MRHKKFQIFINFVTAFVVTLFFSCQTKKVKDQSYVISEEAPIGEAFDVNLKYTDSGRLTAVLNAKKILDYTHRSFAYHEFPEGIILDVIDKEGKVSKITADYAISYRQTGLIDMSGNVDIRTADSTHLKANQLYWDQNINWVFTDQPYKSYLPGGDINEADGFDANQDFTILNSRTNDGVILIKE